MVDLKKGKSKKTKDLDFAPKKKKKLGTVQRPQNKVDTTLHSKRLKVRAALPVTKTLESKPLTNRNLSVRDLVVRLDHFSPKMRRDALLGLYELVSKHAEIQTELLSCFSRIILALGDSDRQVRMAFRTFLKGLVLQQETLVLKRHADVLLTNFRSALLNPLANLGDEVVQVLTLIQDHCSEGLGIFSECKSKLRALLLPVSKLVLKFLLDSKVFEKVSRALGVTASILKILHEKSASHSSSQVEPEAYQELESIFAQRVDSNSSAPISESVVVIAETLQNACMETLKSLDWSDVLQGEKNLNHNLIPIAHHSLVNLSFLTRVWPDLVDVNAIEEILHLGLPSIHSLKIDVCFLSISFSSIRPEYDLESMATTVCQMLHELSRSRNTEISQLRILDVSRDLICLSGHSLWKASIFDALIRFCEVCGKDNTRDVIGRVLDVFLKQSDETLTMRFLQTLIKLESGVEDFQVRFVTSKFVSGEILHPAIASDLMSFLTRFFTDNRIEGLDSNTQVQILAIIPFLPNITKEQLKIFLDFLRCDQVSIVLRQNLIESLGRLFLTTLPSCSDGLPLFTSFCYSITLQCPMTISSEIYRILVKIPSFIRQGIVTSLLNKIIGSNQAHFHLESLSLCNRLSSLLPEQDQETRRRFTQTLFTCNEKHFLAEFLLMFPSSLDFVLEFLQINLNVNQDQGMFGLESKSKLESAKKIQCLNHFVALFACLSAECRTQLKIRLKSILQSVSSLIDVRLAVIESKFVLDRSHDCFDVYSQDQD